MSEMAGPDRSPDQREGGCLCGQVRFKVRGRPLVTMACHCTGCQKMTSSAFSLSALYPREAFALMAGEPVIGGLHGELQHFFCPHCMSWLYTHFPDMDAFLNVRSTMLDDASGYEPFIETCTSEMLPWAKTPAAHSFDKFPPMEQFGALIAEYGAKSGSDEEPAVRQS